MMSTRFWVYLISAMGLALLICGMLSRQPTQLNDQNQCPPSQFTWAPIVIGALMLFIGAITFSELKRGGQQNMPVPPEDPNM